MSFRQLETSRLLIRRFTMHDLTDIHRILDVALHMGDSTLDERTEWLQWTIMNDAQLERLYQPPYGEKAVVLRSTQQLIGAVGLVPSIIPAAQFRHYSHYNPQPTPNAHLRPEFGLFYAFDPAFQGQGYATEAAQALIDFAFKTLNIERIVATTEYDNVRSQAVMRRLGMDVQRNPFPDPFWCQIVGFLENTTK